MFKLDDIEKTLLLPLCARYYLSNKSGVDFHDAVAIRLVESEPQTLKHLMEKLSELECCYFLDRALTMDMHCRRFLMSYPEGRIVHAGSGLDNPFERVDNGQVSWHDLDTPEVIVLRRRYIDANPRQQFIGGSVFDEQWMNALDPKRPALLLFPGVLNYFKWSDVKALLTRINRYFDSCCQIMDVMSNGLSLYLANKTVKKVGGKHAKMRWKLNAGCNDWPSSIKKLQFEPFYTQIPRDMTLKKSTRLMLRLIKTYYHLQYYISVNE